MSEEMMDWSQFDDMVTAEMMEDIKDYEDGKTPKKKDYPEIPFGKYDVVLEKFDFKLSKSGNPMTVVWCRIVSGPFKNGIIFANFMMHTAFTIHKVKKFIRSLDPSSPVEFKSFTQWDIYLKGVQEELGGKAMYVLNYTTTPNTKNPTKPFTEYLIEDGPYEAPEDYVAPSEKQTNGWQTY